MNEKCFSYSLTAALNHGQIKNKSAKNNKKQIIYK